MESLPVRAVIVLPVTKNSIIATFITLKSDLRFMDPWKEKHYLANLSICVICPEREFFLSEIRTVPVNYVFLIISSDSS